MNKFLLSVKLIIVWLQNPVFIIKISEGKIKQVKGRVKNSFLVDCTDIIKRDGANFGIIYAVSGRYGNAVLHGMGELSKDTIQQLRNSWSFQS